MSRLHPLHFAFTIYLTPHTWPSIDQHDVALGSSMYITVPEMVVSKVGSARRVESAGKAFERRVFGEETQGGSVREDATRHKIHCYHCCPASWWSSKKKKTRLQSWPRNLSGHARWDHGRMNSCLSLPICWNVRFVLPGPRPSICEALPPCLSNNKLGRSV